MSAIGPLSGAKQTWLGQSTCSNEDAGLNAEGPSTYFISAAFARRAFSKAAKAFRSWSTSRVNWPCL
jgi:hypothetical protein